MISIMMVTYNRLELTKKTVDNIYETVKDPFNFVIVDNGSTDYTVNYLNELSKEKNNIHLKLNDKNKGIAYGRNQCLLIADQLKTEWYVTLDNDVLLHDGWLNECIDVLKANKHFGAIGVSFESVVYPIIKSNNYEFEFKSKGNLGTACMVFHKSLHKLIGFFTTEYGTFYGEEDANFGVRIGFLGLKIGYIKNHGVHIGEGAEDIGPYREFKDNCRKQNLDKFHKDYNDYATKQKSIYIPFKESE